MEAIREIQKVKNHQVLIKLPDSYENKDVEIIVFPIIKKEKSGLLDLLLQGPVWSDDDVQTFDDIIKKGYQNWTIKEF